MTDQDDTGDGVAIENLFEDIPPHLAEELFETLAHTEAVRIERIVSRGHSSPPGNWYNQERNEWVLLLKGAARLAFADGREVTMGPGDWLEIPAHVKHRVEWTDDAGPTVWLAVHY